MITNRLNTLKQTLLIALSSMILTTTAWAGGAGISGGGTGYQSGLLDLAVYNRPAFHDQTPGSILPETKAYNRFGVGRLNSQSVPVFQKTLAQVKKWISNSPLLAPEVLRALNFMSIYYFKGEFKVAPEGYFIPAGVDIVTSQLKILGIYVVAFGNFTSKPSFDRMTEKNQVGYLIHEAVRHLQIEGLLEISHETLQTITARLVSDPTPNEPTLDTEANLNGGLLYRLKTETLIKDQIADLYHKACQNFMLACDGYDTKVKPRDAFDIVGKVQELLSDLYGNDKYSDKPRFSGEAHAEMDRLVKVAFQTQREIAIYGFVRASDGFIEPVYTLSKLLALGSVDWAIDEVNKKTFYDSRASKLLVELHELLTSPVSN